MYKYIVVLILLLLPLGAFSQIKLSGVITNEQGEYVPYASVVLIDHIDSLKVLSSTISDNNGYYEFNKLSPMKCRLFVSFIGYKDAIEPLYVNFPSAGNTLIKNIVLIIDALSINEVVVTGKAPIQNKIDREIYNITPQQRKNTVTSADIIAGMPKLRFDYATQSVTTIDGKLVKILVNGANATSQDLNTISSENIKSIEYFDIPPAKYSEYSSVVNIITKYNNDGIYGGVNGLSALTTGFVNAGAYLNYNWGDNQLKISGSTYYRDYNNVVSESLYDYKISDKHYVIQQTENRQFGYDDNYISLQYSRNVADKYQLQIKFDPNFQHSHRDATLGINKMINNLNQQLTGTVYDRTRQFTPTLDIYSLVYLPHKSELSVNFTGTYIDAYKNYRREDFSLETSDLILEDALNSNNNKKSVIGQIDYLLPIGEKLTFNIGNKTSYADLKYQLSGTLGSSDNFSKQLQSNTYAELYGSFNKFNFRINATAGYYEIKTNIDQQLNWKFEPQLLLNYKFDDKNSVRFFIKSTSEIPSLAQLSSAQIYIADNLVREGNPLLKLSSTYRTMLNYDYTTSYLLIRAGLLYNKTLRPINTYFIEEGDAIKLKYENAISSSDIGAFISAYFDPFKNQLLTAKFSFVYSYSTIESVAIGQYGEPEFIFNYEIASKIKKFTLSYSGNVRDWTVSGAYRDLGEKNSTLRLSYTHKNFSVNASCYWLLATPNYKSRTLDGSIVDYQFTNTIFDNKNMVTLGFTYNFGVGQKHTSKNKKFNNIDRDSGLF